MSRLVTTLLFFTLAFASCKKAENNASIIRDDGPFAASLKSSPELLTLDGYQVYLQAAIWRDLTPGDGAPRMICLSLLMDKDTLLLPASITLKQQYQVKGDLVWRGPYLETGGFPPNALRGWTDKAPQWTPGDSVDVVCEFVYKGQTHRILDKAVRVN